MLYAFIVFVAVFIAVELYLCSVENRKCEDCEWCYETMTGGHHCFWHDTDPSRFPEEHRKWDGWNRHTATCVYYKPKKER